MLKTMTFLIILLIVGSVSAKNSEQEIARLGQDLTLVGAEKKGNGSDIPAWTGGLQKSKSHPSGKFHNNPYFRETPILIINSENMHLHKDRLSLGSQQLLQYYPSLDLPIYPSHRSASYPEYVYQGIKHNASSASLMKYGSGVSGATMSSPFPIPKNGLEVLWNHTLRFRGHSVGYVASTVHINQHGSRAVTVRDYQYYFAYSDRGVLAEELDNKIFFLKRKALAPASQAGGITLVHETLDQVRSPRKSWIYVPGQRRVRRTPNLDHDTPDIATDSLRTIDQVDMFNGAPTYYEWELLGKQEMYIPYNAYLLHDANLTVEDITGAAHLNAKNLRYEAHRVWVVEAKLRIGLKHRYVKRRYYFDEDSWSIVYAEEYDEAGKLWQFSESHLINYYEVPVMFSTLEVTYDLKEGRYFVEGIDNDRGKTYSYDANYNKGDFTTSAIRREARR